MQILKHKKEGNLGRKKIRERKSRNLDHVNDNKDEDGKILVTDQDKKERKENYFYKLFNDGQGLGLKIKGLEI